jgi:uncharacterized membrane protein YcaP (DUF421 family)
VYALCRRRIVREELAMEWVHDVFGRDQEDITWWQMSLRALLIFLYMTALVRVGARRAFAKMTSVDIVFAVIIGSLLGRAITANSPLLPTMIAAAVLVALHKLTARLALVVPKLGYLAKGTATQVVKDGEILRDAMRRASLTDNDLMEALRESVGIEDLAPIRAAYLERNGTISFIKRDDEATNDDD